MENYELKIKSSNLSLDCPEVEDLTDFCEKNKILFKKEQIELRAFLDNSIFESLCTLFINYDLLLAISKEVISTVAYDALKSLIVKIILKYKNIDCGNKEKSVISNSIELRSDNVYLKIKSTDVTPENVNKAIDCFLKAALEKNEDKTFVVAGDKNEILTLKELEEKYQSQKVWVWIPRWKSAQAVHFFSINTIKNMSI